MDEIYTAIPTEHQSDEAPISAELREHASQNLEIIKQMVELGRSSGTLSKEDEATLREWLEQDVQAPVAEAQQHDMERQQVLAGAAVDTAVGTFHYQEKDGTLTTPEVHQELVNSGEIRPTSGPTN